MNIIDNLVSCFKKNLVIYQRVILKQKKMLINVYIYKIIFEKIIFIK